MRPAPFEYHRAGSVEHALDLLAQFGDEIRPIAGGQSLVPMMNFRLARPSHLVDINRLPLNAVEIEGQTMRVGALARHRELLEHPLLAKHFPALVDAAGYIGHPIIRRNGSIGGSISHADPTAEWPASAVLSDASIVVRSLHGKRQLAAREFFDSAYVTALEPGELVEAIEFPVPPVKSTGSFVELGERSGDFAIASVGIMIEHNDVEITKASMVVSGADLVPIRASEIEAMLIGQQLRAARARQAGEAFSRMIDPVDDHIASAEYRRNLIAQLTERAILKTCARAVQQP